MVTALLVCTSCVPPSQVRTLSVRVDRLTKENAALKKAVADAGQRQATLENSVQRQRQDLNQTLLELSRRVAVSEATWTAARDALEAAGKLQRGSVDLARERAGADAVPAPSLPGAAELLSNAREAAKAGENTQAVVLLEEFLARYPAHSKASIAQRWLGEGYLALGEFESADRALVKSVDGPWSAAEKDTLWRMIAECRRRQGRAAEAEAIESRLAPKADSSHTPEALPVPPASTETGGTETKGSP